MNNKLVTDNIFLEVVWLKLCKTENNNFTTLNSNVLHLFSIYINILVVYGIMARMTNTGNLQSSSLFGQSNYHNNIVELP